MLNDYNIIILSVVRDSTEMDSVVYIVYNDIMYINYGDR